MKNTVFFGLVSVVVAASLLHAGGCGGGIKNTGDADCGDGSECSGNVCVALIDSGHPPVYCSQTCSASSACPSGFYCDSETFGTVGLSFCRFGSSAPSSPPPMDQPPRVVCKTDSDCGSGKVCATFMGDRDCTIPCKQASDCSFSFQGFTFAFETCGADTTSGANNRMVCLPDPNCYKNPQSCIKSGSGGGGPGSSCTANSDCQSMVCADQGGGFMVCM